MVESVTKTDFEDVLKSIRELVADDANIPAEEIAERKQAAKLLLTSDFRVLDTEKLEPLELGAPLVPTPSVKETSQSDKASQDQSEDASQAASNKSSLENTIAELEAAIARQDGDREPDDSKASQPDGQMPMIDEDALREMISGIVRQELQGVLGEKITRNVRKLVRREINLALAAQDFK